LYQSINSAVQCHHMPPYQPHYRSLLRASMISNGCGISKHRRMFVSPTKENGDDKTADKDIIGNVTSTVHVSFHFDEGKKDAVNLSVPIIIPRYLEEGMGGDGR